LLVGIRKSPESALTAFLRDQAKAAFGVVDGHLKSARFMVGDAPTIADLSMVGYLYYDEETGIDWNQFPNIRAWTDRITALPGWRHPYELLPLGHSDKPGLV
jgi:glutathione S-transferase